jgi:nucleotide-binding universal stress UspA family protein
MAARPFRLLLPLDGSSEAESILAAVLPLADRRPLRLTLFRALSRGAERPAAEAYLARACLALERRRIEVRAQCCLDDPADAIISHAVSDNSDLIAMTTHGRSGVRRLVMGSVTEKVLRQAPVPLLACRPGSRMEGWAHVVGLDGSSRAESVLENLLPIARLLGATLHLLHVGDSESNAGIRAYLKKVALRCSSLGVPVTTAVRTGPPSPGIIQYAADVRAGMVALATHGRTGLERLLLGSVAEQVLRNGSCPVLLRRKAEATATLAPGLVGL